MNQKPFILQLPGLQCEVGVTDVSLANSRYLTKMIGKPSLVVLKKTSKGEWFVTSYWGEKKFNWVFNGFAFGYNGEGPKGLLTYLTELGIKVTMQRIVCIQDKDCPVVFETP